MVTPQIMAAHEAYMTNRLQEDNHVYMLLNHILLS